MSLTLLIPLTNSDKFLMVDMEDQQLAEYRWRLDASGYATINMQAGRTNHSQHLGLRGCRLSRWEMEGKISREWKDLLARAF